MNTTASPLLKAEPPWDYDATTMTDKPLSSHTSGNRTVEPTRRDTAQVRQVVLADTWQSLAWPRACERDADARITASYVFPLQLTDDIRGDVGDIQEYTFSSVSLDKVVNVTFVGSPLSPIEARTPLGKRLLALRQKIVASGAPLLDWDDIDREIRSRRGERE